METVADRSLSASLLRERLTDVLEVNDDIYVAICPVCKTPGRSLAFKNGGRELSLHCSKGCTAEQIAAAVDPMAAPILVPPTATDTLPFPYHAIPKPLQELATESARAGGYPPEFVIVPGLSALAGAIGSTYEAQFSTQWVERPILWTAVVARPGTGKSPALDLVMEPFHMFDRGIRAQYLQDHRAWDVKSGEPEPILRRSVISNITLEAKIELLADNPRGVVRAVDEVSEVVGALNQYKGGSGSDRQQLLTLWSGGTMSRDRIKQKAPVIVDNPTCSITGGMQPSRVPGFLAGDDGMSQRWLLAYFPNCKVHPGSDALPAVREVWNQLIFRILAADFDGVSTRCPLEPEARALWDAFKMTNAQRGNAAPEDAMASFWSKLSRHAGRIIITLHVANAFAEGVRPLKTIRARTVQHGIDIAEWFGEQYRCNQVEEENLMLPRTLRDQDLAVDRLLEFLRRKGEPVSRREIQRARVGGCRTAAEVDALLGRFALSHPECVIGDRYTSGDSHQ